jgi:Pentapeptide repeats (8 copies)
VLKRWVGWPPRIRWLVGIAAVALGLALVWALFVPIADWLAHHDVGPATGPLHEAALDNARGRLLTLGAGLLAAGALLFTARNFALSREGQVTDRYTKAIEQLGSDKLDVRIGGIYALERIARDSARDHPTVMEVLTAFIREHSREPWSLPRPDAHPERSTRPDVQAAITVVGRRDRKRENRLVDISGASLIRAFLPSAYLRDAYLDGANLHGAALPWADLRGALLRGADLSNAHLDSAQLIGAHLSFAQLAGADLRNAVLTDANLIEARLPGAMLDNANLTGADLTRASLDGATLRGTDFTRGILHRADLTNADIGGAVFASTDLTGAMWPKDAPVPEGWTLSPGTGRLKRPGAAPRPAEGD